MTSCILGGDYGDSRCDRLLFVVTTGMTGGVCSDFIYVGWGLW